MKKIVLSLGLVALTFAGLDTGHAQLVDRMQKFGEDFAKGYSGPFTDAFGASLNSGWYSSADVSDGLDLYVGVRVMLMPIPDDAKKFKIKSIWNNTEQEIPTAFGDETEVPISGAPAGVNPANYPKGFNFGFAPMFVPHISVGNIFGTRLMLRYLPKVKVGDIGDFEFFGIGVQHSISRYIPLVPLDVSVLVAYQSFSVGSAVSAKAFTIGAQASKSFTVLTVYGGFAYESSKMTFDYDATFDVPNPPPPTATTTVTKHIGFDTNGKNNFRATVGLAVSLAVVKISADYSLASQPVATLGFGVGW